MKHLTRILAASAALGAVACGQKGPLYLPDHDGSVVTRPTRPAETAPQQAPQGRPPQGTTPQGSTNPASPASTPQGSADATRQQADKNDGAPPPK